MKDPIKSLLSIAINNYTATNPGQRARPGCILTDSDVAEIEILTVTAEQRRDAVARERRVGNVLAGARIETRCVRTRVVIQALAAVISGRTMTGIGAR